MLVVGGGKITADGGAENSYNVQLAYDAPVYYPDWSLDGLLYVKQIIASLFFLPQYLHLPAEVMKYEYKAGLEVKMDVDFSFLSAPLRVGWAVFYDKKQGFQHQPTFYYRFNASE